MFPVSILFYPHVDNSDNKSIFHWWGKKWWCCLSDCALMLMVMMHYDRWFSVDECWLLVYLLLLFLRLLFAVIVSRMPARSSSANDPSNKVIQHEGKFLIRTLQNLCLACHFRVLHEVCTQCMHLLLVHNFVGSVPVEIPDTAFQGPDAPAIRQPHDDAISERSRLITTIRSFHARCYFLPWLRYSAFSFLLSCESSGWFSSSNDV